MRLTTPSIAGNKESRDREASREIKMKLRKLALAPIAAAAIMAFSMDASAATYILASPRMVMERGAFRNRHGHAKGSMRFTSTLTSPLNAPAGGPVVSGFVAGWSPSAFVFNLART